MKWFASIALTITLIVLPQTPATAACSSTRLATPAGMTTAYPTHHAGTGWIVGSGWVSNHWEGILWRNGVPQRLPNPVAGDGSNYPRAVNASGVIGGYWIGGSGKFAWRYSNGVYQQLPGLGTRASIVKDINASGDLVGFASYLTAGDTPRVMLWKASTPSQFTDLGVGDTAGIDDAGRVVIRSGTIVNPDGSQVPLDNPGAAFAANDFTGGRIVGFKGTQAPYTTVEWNLSGDVVREIANLTPHAISASGVITAFRDGSKVLVRGSAVDVVSSPVPAVRMILGITGDDVVISDSGGSTYQWRC